MTYLENLTARLLLGIAQVPEPTRQRHADFLVSWQNDDGGFAGREGGSDLYYTGFALRSIAILGRLDTVAEQAAKFLKSRLGRRESIVDFYSLIYAARLLDAVADMDVFANVERGWTSEVAAMLGRLRRDDGGFAKGEEGQASSTYHSFLALLCHELIDEPVAEPDKLIKFFRSQRTAEGGFREIRVSRRAGTNPTAAAIAGLKILDALDAATMRATGEFLVEMQTEDGGFRANTRIPFADLLSTFTSLLTLADLETLDAVDLSAAQRYVESLESQEGGFLGADWDEVRDVEYTFYGLGSMAVLSEIS
jgi:geranylgeranyl transferase type-2 subunit beta